MGDLIYFVKSLVITFVIIILLQVKIGDQTLEERSYHLAKESSVGVYLTEVAHSGVIFLRKGYEALLGNLDGKFTDTFNRSNIPGKRKLIEAVDRSKTYIDEKKLKAERDQYLEEFEEAEKALEENL